MRRFIVNSRSSINSANSILASIIINLAWTRLIIEMTSRYCHMFVSGKLSWDDSYSYGKRRRQSASLVSNVTLFHDENQYKLGDAIAILDISFATLKTRIYLRESSRDGQLEEGGGKITMLTRKEIVDWAAQRNAVSENCSWMQAPTNHPVNGVI